MKIQSSRRVWTPVELIRWTADYLAEKGVPEARLTAEHLLAGGLGLKRLDLYLQFDRPLTPEELERFRSDLRRRARREPLQYIAGTAAFRELTVAVDRRVLIPRPETELLVGEVLTWAAERPGLDVVDIGTGSGAIALSLRHEGDFNRVVATDVSADALDVARANLQKALSGDAQVDFRHGSGYEPVTGERFDIIVSNPPYVAAGDRATMEPEVARWEPPEALFCGADGLDLIRRLIARASAHLQPRGLLALEFGADQAAEVAELVRLEPSLGEPRIRKDHSGRDRMLIVELRE